MSAIALTGADLIRAIGQMTAPAVARATRERADALAREIESAAGNRPVSVHVVDRGPTDIAVVVFGPGIFSRAPGSLNTAADSSILTSQPDR